MESKRHTVILVEDEPIIAMMIADVLCGYDLLIEGVFASNRDALIYLDQHKPDIAVLDFGLTDGKVDQTARRLDELGVPFCVISGFQRQVVTDPVYDHAAWIDKPFSVGMLQSALKTALLTAS